MELFNKLLTCTLAGLLATGVAVADDKKDTSTPGMSQGDSHEMMKSLSDEERQVMREKKVRKLACTSKCN